MAHNTPYRGIKKAELEQILKGSKAVSSFAGSYYVKMHKSVIQEIQAQKDHNEKAIQSGMHMTINSGLDNPLHLRSDIEKLVDELSQIVQADMDIQYPVTEDLIFDLRELAAFCITTEPQAEQKAERILIRGENASSRKLYNIRFNIKGAISLLFDWILLGNITESASLQLAVMLVRSVAKLYDLTLKKFDAIHAAVLQEIYSAPKVNGMAGEDEVIEHVLTRYGKKHSDWDSATIRNAITELNNFRCIELADSKIAITEAVVIR